MEGQDEGARRTALILEGPAGTDFEHYLWRVYS
jgi:hypothetical protein